MSKHGEAKTVQEIQAWLVEQLAEMLVIDPQNIDIHKPFLDFGLSSREAVMLSGDMEQWLDRRLSPTLVWEHPTIAEIASFLAGKEVEETAVFPNPLRATKQTAADEPIAIIGIGCRFPGANGPEAFWQLLINGIDAISEVPTDRWPVDALYAADPQAPGKMNTRWGGFLDDVAQFDAAFFHISPREAASMDPQQRLLLETVWEALADAGQPPHQLAGSATGTFVGICSNDYAQIQGDNLTEIDAYVGTGNAHSIAANRLAYLLDLRGPSLAVDTACSSSLVAVHLACESLRRGECTLALAGGVNVILSPALTVNFTKAGVMSPDGRSRAFAAEANGYVRGEGAGMVVLKPLAAAQADGDPIYAVILGSAVNQDGRSNGLMAPNPQAQEAVLRAAYANAGVSPGAVQYVEAHGTGTLLGDPIEAQALGAVLAEERPKNQPCLVGSVKSNIGHLEAAAGVAGLMKVALTLHHQMIPPSLHFDKPNPYIPFAELPLCVPQNKMAWPKSQETALAGVSSFGFGGTNAHVVVSAAPPKPERKAPGGREGMLAHLLPLSAKTPEALHELATNYCAYLERETAVSISDLCYTASIRRSHYDERLAVIGHTSQELLENLQNWRQAEPAATNQQSLNGPQKLAFVFSGQGSQWIGMGRELFQQEPVFRQSILACEQALSRYVNWSLIDVLISSESLEDISIIQPTLFAVQVALAELWQAWGVEPDAVVGHSLGEVAAAHIAGALNLDDAAHVICARSCLMKQVSGLGEMLVVGLPAAEVRKMMNGNSRHLSVAVKNSPTNTVIGGEPGAVAKLSTALHQQGIYCRSVKVDVAAHSPQMEKLQPALRRMLATVQPQAEKIALFSTVTGTRTRGEELDADYWSQNLRQPVQFIDAMQALCREGISLFLEVSPHPVLTQAMQDDIQCAQASGLVLASLRRDQPERAALLTSLGRLYTSRIPVNWEKLHVNGGRVIPLPAYPWQHQRYWFKGNGRFFTQNHLPNNSANLPESAKIDDWLYKVAWEPADRPEANPIPFDTPGSWLIFADQSGVGTALAEKLRLMGEQCVLAFAGTERKHLKPDTAQIRADSAADIAWFWHTMLPAAQPPCRGIVHLWSLDVPAPSDLSESTLAEAQNLTCSSTLHLVQQISRQSSNLQPKLWLVTQGVQPVGNFTELSVGQSPLWGFGRALAQEVLHLWGGLVDMDPKSDAEVAAANLLSELCVPDGEDQLALRQGRRYAARLVREDTAGETAVSPQWRTDGSYLITGGLGDLGLQVANWMAAQGVRRLILMSRTAVPPRQTWSQINPDSRMGRRLAAIRKLESLGATVHFAAVDVADREQLAAFLSHYATEQLPPIRGVVHAAGVLQDRSVTEMEPGDLQTVLAPKIAGAWNLHQLLAKSPLDFFVFFSSAAALLPQPGQANYAAANAFLDALATLRRANALPGMSINWGIWDGLGMAAKDSSQQFATRLARLGVETIPAQAGVATLQRLLGVKPEVAQIMALPVNWETLRQKLPEAAQTPFLANLLTNEEAALTSNQAKKGHFVSPPQAITTVNEMSHYLQKQVAQVLFLDLAATPLDRNLQELGLDSIMLMSLIRNIERDLSLHLYPRELLERPYINQLASYLIAELERHQGKQLDSVIEPAPAASSSELVKALTRSQTRFYQPPPEKRNESMIFLLSAPRSGSTLLRVMLAGHPELFCPPELHLLPFTNMQDWQDALDLTYLGEGLQRAFMELMNVGSPEAKNFVDQLIANGASIQDVYAKLQKLIGSRLLVDKSPSYGLSKDVLQQAEVLFKDAKYIHLIRHPYAMIESSMRIRLEKVMDNSSMDPQEFAEEVWTRANQNIHEFGKQIGPGRFCTIRFEDLTQSPEQVGRELSTFLDLPFADAILHPYQGQRMTDGVHAGSLRVGDPNFHKHQQIDPALATVWQQIKLPRSLQPETQAMAAQLGYQLPMENGMKIVPNTDLSEKTTVETAESPIVPIQTSGVRPPFFCVHPGSGAAYPYYELSYRLGPEQPFYGLQDSSLLGVHPPHSRIEDYATEYVAAIRSVQPEGPYFIGGWSFGGSVAFEIARQLDMAGQKMGLVLIIDAQAPVAGLTLSRRQKIGFWRDEMQFRLAALRYLVPYIRDAWFLFTKARERRRSSKLSISDYFRWAWRDALQAYFAKEAAISDVVAKDERFAEIQLPTESTVRGVKLLNYHVGTRLRYNPDSPYPGKIVLLRAEDQRAFVRYYKDPQLGWDRFVDGEVEVHEVPGNHMVLFHEPYIITLAETIERCLERAIVRETAV